MKTATPMQINVNGTTQHVEISGHTTLLDVLRDQLSLSGARLSCGRGECGACTVLLSEPQGGPRRPVYACITLAAACDGARVTTIEGLGEGGLHPLQEAFIARDAVQCGYCTPGQILAAAALLDQTLSPSTSEIRAAMSGNLCRCGTYPNIVLAIQDAAKALAQSGVTSSPAANSSSTIDAGR